MFNFNRQSELKKIAHALADDIVKRYPPALDTTPNKRPSPNRLTRILEDTCQSAIEYQEKSRLGWIARARLANAFKWRLKDHGYTDAFIELATEAIVVHLSKKTKL